MGMMNGKDENGLKHLAENIAKERGVDLSALAKELGITMPQ